MGFLLIAPTAGVLFTSACSSACGNRLVRQTLQAGAAHELVVFDRDCGATTDFVTHVTLLDGGDSLSNGTVGNIFIADSDHGKVSMNVEATWSTPSTIVVRYPTGAKIYKKVDQVNEFRVRYQEY